VTLFDRLLPYQRAWIQDKSRFKICVSSRQIGKSFETAFGASVDCAKHPGAEWLIMSAGQRQADEWMRKAARITRAVHTDLAAEGFDLRVEYSTSEIKFANGSRIISVPANPDTARGYSANLILDEFAIHENDREVWAAVAPSITNELSGMKRIEIISTPKGMENIFAEIWHEGGERWSRHHVTLDDAIAQGLRVDKAALREAVADEDIWRQEFYCEFLANDTCYFPLDLIRAAERVPSPTAPAGAPRFLGVDIGRAHDLTAIAELAAVGDALLLVDLETLERAPFAEQRELLWSRLSRPSVRGCAIDATGIGAQLAEETRAKFGGRIVEPVQFTNAVKNGLFQSLRRALDESRLVLPADRELREDIHAVHRKISTGGNIQFIAPRRADGHSDRACAIALAVDCAERNARRGPIVPPEVLVAPVNFRTRRIMT
jgi:phage FluMu gp28-like protein